MSFINCIICSGPVSVVGKPSHVIRKVKCKNCGLININCKNIKQTEIIVLPARNEVKETLDDGEAINI